MSDDTRSLRRRAGIAEENVRIKKEQLVEAKEQLVEAEEQYDEEHRTFTAFSKKLEEKWEQRFNALAVLAHGAGVQTEDIEAVRRQPWQSRIPEQRRVLKWSESPALHWLEPQLLHLRFAVGSDVMVAVPFLPGSEHDRPAWVRGVCKWKRGVVECQLHRDESFPAGRWAAYRVKLETPWQALTHVYVPVDCNRCIQLPEVDDGQSSVVDKGRRDGEAEEAEEESACYKPWSQLSVEQQQLAARLTFCRETWGDNPTEDEAQGFKEDWRRVLWTWKELQEDEELQEELEAALALGFDASSWQIHDEDDYYEPWSWDMDAAIEADDPRLLAKVVTKYVRRGHREVDIYYSGRFDAHLLQDAAEAGASRIVEHLVGRHGLKSDGTRACMLDSDHGTSSCCSRQGLLRTCPSQRFYEGDSALHSATGMFKIHTMATLIRLGADIDHQNRWGCTPLGLALFRFLSSRSGPAHSSRLSVAHPSLAAVRLLLSHGASLYCSNIRNIYPVRAHVCDLAPWRDELHPVLRDLLRKPPDELRGITVCPDVFARHNWLLVWAAAVRQASAACAASTRVGAEPARSASSVSVATLLGSLSRELMQTIGLKLTRGPFEGLGWPGVLDRSVRRFG